MANFEGRPKKDGFFLNTRGGRKTNEDKPGKFHQKSQDIPSHVDDTTKEGKPERKPFDKKTYRLKKYSHKYKLEQYEKKRRLKLLRTYYKDVKSEVLPSGSYKEQKFDQPAANQDEKVEDEPGDPMSDQGKDNKKNSAYWKAQKEFERMQGEKVKQKQSASKAIEERKAALEEYKKKKTEKFKKLNKKTKKGQPVMTGRLELMLEKIQRQKMTL